MLYRLGAPDLSSWARELLDTSGVPQVGLVPELMAELGEKSSGIPELVAVAVSRQAELATFEPGEPGRTHRWSWCSTAPTRPAISAR